MSDAATETMTASTRSSNVSTLESVERYVMFVRVCVCDDTFAFDERRSTVNAVFSG